VYAIALMLFSHLTAPAPFAELLLWVSILLRPFEVFSGNCGYPFLYYCLALWRNIRPDLRLQQGLQARYRKGKSQRNLIGLEFQESIEKWIEFWLWCIWSHLIQTTGQKIHQVAIGLEFFQFSCKLFSNPIFRLGIVR
jgi:hypothetical protein